MGAPLISTLEDLEAAMLELKQSGIQVAFGPSVSPVRHQQWFASATVLGDPVVPQVRAASLSEAVNGLLGRCEVQDVIEEAPKVTAQPKRPDPKPSQSDLSTLLV